MTDPDSRPLRTSERKTVQTEFRLGDESGSGEITLDTHDLSEGGAFLEAEMLFDVGDELELEFSLPGSDRVIQTRSRIAWVSRGRDGDHPAGMGIQFDGLHDEDREALVAYLKG